MNYLSILVFLFSNLLWAAQLPTEISDNYLKVKAVELMRIEMESKFYNIEDFLVSRTQMDDAHFAVAINNVRTESGDCLSFLVIASSKNCKTYETCRLIPKIYSCSSLNANWKQLFE